MKSNISGPNTTSLTGLFLGLAGLVLGFVAWSIGLAEGDGAPATDRDDSVGGARISPYPDYNPCPIPPDRSGMESTAAELAAKMRVGWNAGNSLEAIGGETAWGNPVITRELVRLVKASGFGSVRLPASWDQYADEETAEIDIEWLDRVRQVVQYCIDEDLFVLLNIHWDGGWLENNVTREKQAANNAKQRAFWEQIATHFRDFDERLLFAGANEPNVEEGRQDQMEVLMSYHQTFIDAVRSTGGRNAWRVLVVQGPNTDIQRTFDLMDGMPLDTVPDRLMLEVHYYTPYNFCGLEKDESWGRQFYYWGEGYHSETDTDRNATWGEEEELDRLFGLMEERFVDRGIPVVLGEFGAIRRLGLRGDDLELHLASRTYFLDAVTERSVANGFIPFYWDNGPDVDLSFAIFDRETCTVAYPTDLQALTAIDSEPFWTECEQDAAGPRADFAVTCRAGRMSLVESPGSSP